MLLTYEKLELFFVVYIGEVVLSSLTGGLEEENDRNHFSIVTSQRSS